MTPLVSLTHVHRQCGLQAGCKGHVSYACAIEQSSDYEVGRGLTVAQAKSLLEGVVAERLQVTQTLQRVDGQLQLLPPKTRHSRRTIPFLHPGSRRCASRGPVRALAGGDPQLGKVPQPGISRASADVICVGPFFATPSRALSGVASTSQGSY